MVTEAGCSDPVQEAKAVLARESFSPGCGTRVLPGGQSTGPQSPAQTQLSRNRKRKVRLPCKGVRASWPPRTGSVERLAEEAECLGARVCPWVCACARVYTLMCTSTLVCVSMCVHLSVYTRACCNVETRSKVLLMNTTAGSVLCRTEVLNRTLSHHPLLSLCGPFQPSL